MVKMVKMVMGLGSEKVVVNQREGPGVKYCKLFFPEILDFTKNSFDFRSQSYDRELQRQR
jgi:hypothetical protein